VRSAGPMLGHWRDLAMPKEGAGGTSGRMLLVAPVLCGAIVGEQRSCNIQFVCVSTAFSFCIRLPI
jgi:hypothetical protein